MKTLPWILVLGYALLFPPDATAVLKGGCVKPRPPEVPGIPEDPVRQVPLKHLPVIHEVRGIRTAGHGTYRLRTFPLRANGFLCGEDNQETKTDSRPSRSRVAVSLSGQVADWDKKVQLTVSRLADFRIIFRSGNPSSFDSFTFLGVDPGSYVFTLDSLGDWRDPVELEVEYHGRIIATRTVYPEAMDHPAMATVPIKKRAPRETLFSSR